MPKLTKEERAERRREKASNALYVFSQMTFGAVCLGAFSPLVQDPDASISPVIFLGGLAGTAFFFYLANQLIR